MKQKEKKRKERMHNARGAMPHLMTPMIEIAMNEQAEHKAETTVDKKNKNYDEKERGKQPQQAREEKLVRDEYTNTSDQATKYTE